MLYRIYHTLGISPLPSLHARRVRCRPRYIESRPSAHELPYAALRMYLISGCYTAVRHSSYNHRTALSSHTTLSSGSDDLERSIAQDTQTRGKSLFSARSSTHFIFILPGTDIIRLLSVRRVGDDEPASGQYWTIGHRDMSYLSLTANTSPRQRCRYQPSHDGVVQRKRT